MPCLWKLDYCRSIWLPSCQKVNSGITGTRHIWGWKNGYPIRIKKEYIVLFVKRKLQKKFSISLKQNIFRLKYLWVKEL
jgi:hypothetical protein